MKKFHISFAIACEHIVQGEGNKPTFIGAYLSKINVAAFPATFWISFFVQIEDIRFISVNPKASVFLNDAQVGEMELPLDGLDYDIPLSLSVPAGIMNLTENATIKLILSAEGFEDAIAVATTVQLAKPV